MRKPHLAFAVVAGLGLLAFALAALLLRTPVAFSVGAANTGAVADVVPGHVLCQTPIETPAGGAFDRVTLTLGTYRRPGPPLGVDVRGRSGALLAHGSMAGGYPDITKRPSYTIGLGRMLRPQQFELCLHNLGHRRVAVYGSGGVANRQSTATVDGKPIDADLNLVFERPPRSYASELGVILGRAVLFRSPRLSPTVYGVVLVALVLAAALALGLAVRAAEGSDT
jgi:hypothetical protein